MTQPLPVQENSESRATPRTEGTQIGVLRGETDDVGLAEEQKHVSILACTSTVTGKQLPVLPVAGDCKLGFSFHQPEHGKQLTNNYAINLLPLKYGDVTFSKLGLAVRRQTAEAETYSLLLKRQASSIQPAFHSSWRCQSLHTCLKVSHPGFLFLTLLSSYSPKQPEYCP